MKNHGNPFVGRLALLALVLTFISHSAVCFAQGTAFTYEGQLNESGAPANGLYDISAGLFAAASGGSPVAGPYTNSAVPVTNGLFTLVLDFGDVFDGASYWLQIAVRTNGSGSSFMPLSPRQQLTPVPYAIFANTASNLSGTLPVGQLSGALAASQLSGVYSDVVAISNSSDSFTGNGAGLAALNASKLASGVVPDARLSANVARTNQVWLLGGNAGVATGDNIIGTTDNQYLDIKANNMRVMRYRLVTDASESYSNAPNVVGGSPINGTSSGVVGATVAGGGGYETIDGFADSNTVTADFGTVGGGHKNTASGKESFVGGGYNNVASGQYSVVVGGGDNTALYDASVLGGSENFASNYYAAVCGGDMNVAGGNSSFVGGGDYNTAYGEDAVVPGGLNNEASGAQSFAAGDGATAHYNNSFVWSDGAASPNQFSDTGPNQFLISASGGVGIGLNNPNSSYFLDVGGRIELREDPRGNSAGLWLYQTSGGDSAFIGMDQNGYVGLWGNKGAEWGLIMNVTNKFVGIGATPDAMLTVNGGADKPGGGSWSTYSDARLKDVGPEFTNGLASLAEIQPVHYHYKSDNPLKLPSQPEYVGVVAQQVRSAVPEAVQENPAGYLTVNNDPVIWTMVNAIKELNQKVDQKAAENEALKAQNDALAARLTELERAVQQLGQK